MPARDWLLALLLGSVTLATRVPFRARLLPTWDAIQFALALGHYDIVRHQPHPPGYILFVGAARAVQALAGDPTRSLTWLAVGASAVAVVLVYRLGWELYGRSTAVLAAVGLAVSPLFWFYGEVGLSYTAEAALATWVAMLAWRMGRGGGRAVVASALALGLAGGVRQSILVILLPLWLGMAWAGCRRWRPLAGGLVLIGLVSAAWFVPMVWLTGGLGRYLGATLELYDSTVRPTTVWWPGGRWLGNVLGLGLAFLLGLGVLLPAFGWLVVAAAGRASPRGPRARFFLWWIAPALAVYGFVHLGQLGYALTVLPAVYLLIARGLVLLWRRGAITAPAIGGRGLAAALLAATVLAHTAFFAAAGPVDVRFPPAAAPWRERAVARVKGFYRFQLWAHTARGLREREAVIRTYVDAVRRDFDPSDTVLVTELGNPRSYPWFRHAMYYLSEFTAYYLRVGDGSPGYLISQDVVAMAPLGSSDVVLPASARHVVWVVDAWNPAVPRPPGLRAIPLGHGRRLYVLDVDRRAVEYAGYRLTPVTALARLR
jgi:hypothetical protein